MVANAAEIVSTALCETTDDDNQLELRVLLRAPPSLGESPARFVVEWRHSSWWSSQRDRLACSARRTATLGARVHKSHAVGLVVRAYAVSERGYKGPWSESRQLTAADLPSVRARLSVRRWVEEDVQSPVLVLLQLSTIVRAAAAADQAATAAAATATEAAAEADEPLPAAELEPTAAAMAEEAEKAEEAALRAAAEKEAARWLDELTKRADVDATSSTRTPPPLVERAGEPSSAAPPASSEALVAASPSHAALAATAMVAGVGRLMVDGVARGVEHVSASLRLTVGELAHTAAARTVDAALALRARASHGGRQELLLEHFEMQRRRPRGAPPLPQRGATCRECVAEGLCAAEAAFGLTRHRHHCAHCGGSFCAPHVQWRRSVDHKFARDDKAAAAAGGNAQGGASGSGYEGGGAEVRVCWGCVLQLEREAYENTIAERLCRCCDFLGGTLPPYVARVEDSAGDKVWRIGAIGLQVAKALPLTARASLTVHSLEYLLKCAAGRSNRRAFATDTPPSELCPETQI